MRVKFDTEDPTTLSGIGDSFVNLIYSLALSNVSGKAQSKRAHNYVLAEALLRADLRGLAGPRLDRHGLADFVEGYIFHAWAGDHVTIRECVDILEEGLNDPEVADMKEKSIIAFANLLLTIKGRV